MASSGSSKGGCTTNKDCGQNMICGFPESGGCSAEGSCFHTLLGVGPVCLVYEPGCACDGSETNLACNGLPSGYAAKPISHRGVCEQADATAP
jgi:hypothetical protein